MVDSELGAYETRSLRVVDVSVFPLERVGIFRQLFMRLQSGRLILFGGECRVSDGLSRHHLYFSLLEVSF